MFEFYVGEYQVLMIFFWNSDVHFIFVFIRCVNIQFLEILVFELIFDEFFFLREHVFQCC